MIPILRTIRARLTFANAMSCLALFVALGGTAYAATALPSGSVGTEQLQARAVTASKIAPGAVDSRQIAPGAVTGVKIADGAIDGSKIAARSVMSGALGGGSVDTTQLATGAVTFNRLSERVQKRLLDTARGEAGPQGPAGPAGPGASRFRYSAPADGAPPQTVIDTESFRMRATCDVGNDGTGVSIRITPADDVTIMETVSVDSGADIAQGGQQNFTGNLAIALPGGVETTVGGPATQTGFARAIATLVMAFPARTVTATVAIVVDANTGRCSIDGTAVAGT